MNFIPTPIAGAFEILPRAFEDNRGSFTRLFCENMFKERGLASHFPQCNLSRNPQAGTLRGLHLQRAPHAEVKLVRALSGRIFDVAVDLRPDSPSYLQWHGVELRHDKQNAFYIPEGCAHGFMTLEAHCDLLYHVSANWTPEAEQGFLWNDPSFAIAWPCAPTLISEKDQSHARYVAAVPS